MSSQPNSLADLAGWQDFTQALYASATTLHGVQYASYDTAVQGKLAELDTGLKVLQSNPATAGIEVIAPSDPVALDADYYGVVTAGIPFNVSFGVKLLGNSVLSDSRTTFDYSESVGVVGSQTSPGVFQVTSVTREQAKVVVKISFAGVLQGRWTVPVNVTKAPAPIPPPPDPDVPPPTPPPTAQSATAAVALQGAYTPGAFQLVGSVDVVGGYTYRAFEIGSLVPAQSTIGQGSVEMYIAYAPKGSTAWVEVGAHETGQAAYIALVQLSSPYGYAYGYNPSADPVYSWESAVGYINISRDVVLPAGDYTIGFFAKQLYNLPVNFSDNAVVEAI